MAENLDQHTDFRKDMMRSVLTEPLKSKVLADPDGEFDIIVCLNELHEHGIENACADVEKWILKRGGKPTRLLGYVFARMQGRHILDLVAKQRAIGLKKGYAAATVYRIWEDSEFTPCLTRSVGTIKADAAHRAFRALGKDIVWAVLDSGIDGSHPHFTKREILPYGSLDPLQLTPPVAHRDFTPGEVEPLEDRFGHGTHVAGVIAGCYETSSGEPEPIIGVEILAEGEGENARPAQLRLKLERVCGVAPLCRMVSLKVIADRNDANPATRRTQGRGRVSWLLRALDYIQQINQNGRRILIHGANLSLGYGFDPRWFACGQSPMCVEVNRLVRNGVAVVVAAGNDGHVAWIDATGKPQTGYSDLSINDPGNADLAVTVGSTHRDMPHTYGVSYFSSKGPTGDGRLKPDMVAPGERIISCAAGLERDKFGADILYVEQSGTSMAAPHVSGAIAAFLSVRTEFIGQPERVKQILLANTIDLGRERYFQGHGLLDLMKVLQAV